MTDRPTPGAPDPATPPASAAADAPPTPPAPVATRPVADPRALEARRRFLKTAAVGAGVVGVALSGALPVLRGGSKRLRPPGALDERDFLAACIKCGQCVQVCPVSAIQVADLFDGFGVGVPYIEPRQQACDFACDVGQCILACPTGALVYHRPEDFPPPPGSEVPSPPVLLAKKADPEPTMNFTQRMGVARLARPEACLSVKGEGVDGPARGGGFRGKHRYAQVDRWTPQPVREHDYQLERCDVCVRECPIDGAISIEARPGPDGAPRFTPVVHEACVGCGTCEMVCPVEAPAIVVDARATWGGAS